MAIELKRFIKGIVVWKTENILSGFEPGNSWIKGCDASEYATEEPIFLVNKIYLPSG